MRQGSQRATSDANGLTDGTDGPTPIFPTGVRDWLIDLRGSMGCPSIRPVHVSTGRVRIAEEPTRGVIDGLTD